MRMPSPVAGGDRHRPSCLPSSPTTHKQHTEVAEQHARKHSACEGVRWARGMQSPPITGVRYADGEIGV